MPPPSLLLGMALLFWGIMTDRIWVGAACALLVEGARYSPFRWPFTEVAYVRAWRLSVLVLVIILALVLMDRVDPRAMSRVFSWLPVILLPLIFVQAYGDSPTMSLGAFSLMVRRRRVHADKFGLPFREIRFSFGNVYLAGILICSSLGSKAGSPLYLPLVVAIVGWVFLHRRKFAWRYLPVIVGLSLLPAAAIALAGQKGITTLYNRLIGIGEVGTAPISNIHDTSLGDLGELKQSQDVLWRVKPVQGSIPRLLRTMSYQTYAEGRWYYREFPEGVASFNDDSKNLVETANPENSEDPNAQYVLCTTGEKDRSLVDGSLPRFHLRGAMTSKNMIPLPGTAASFHGMGLFQEITLNSMGGIRVDPIDPVVDTDVLRKEGRSVEAGPWKRKVSVNRQPALSYPDLDIPQRDRKAVADVAEQLHLSEGTLEEKIDKLKLYFASQYHYSTYNSVPKKVAGGGTLVSTFLTTEHRGHCEFFASATCLLLRQAGIPTRYSRGFAVLEYDSVHKENVIRGTHAHAWCRAWDEEHQLWVDVDTTPPSWFSQENTAIPRFQALFDWVKIQREAFIVWRGKPGRMALVTAVLLTPVAIGLLIIWRILWRSRRRAERAQAIRRGAAIPATPLNRIERLAAKVIGPRPEGRPLASWLTGLAPRLERPEMLKEALELHQELRFDPGANVSTLEEKLKPIAAELQAIVRTLPKVSS